jgi:radical SAM superfamily enzyme YgiQ (UPF0313 family)
MERTLFIVHDLHQEDNHFPVGIGYLAAVAATEGEVAVCSADVFHLSNEQVQKVIVDWKPTTIALGFLAARFKETVIGLCEAINEVKGDAKLVLGGHGASACPEYIQEITDCDEIVVGEGESYWGAEEKDIDGYLWPSWDLFPIEKYATSLKLPGWEKGDRTLGILTSRGCVGKCNFCYRMTEGLRLRSMDDVVEEMYQLNSHFGINYFFMQDELFVSSRQRMYTFHEELERVGLLGKIKFACDSRVNIVNEELLECLKECGCQYLDYGFESMDDNVLEIMKKGATSKENYDAAKLTQKVGIPFNINILWGNLGDTPETLKKNEKFIREFNTHKNIRTIRPPTPYPGSELYDIALEKGLLTGPDDFFKKFKNSDLMTVNFTEMEDSIFYHHLYASNSDLISDYYNCKADELAKGFENLYFNNKTDFRGARHYA